MLQDYLGFRHSVGQNVTFGDVSFNDREKIWHFFANLLTIKCISHSPARPSQNSNTQAWVHTWRSLFFNPAPEAVHAEGTLPEWGDLSEPGAAGGAQRAGGEVPAVCWGAGALLRHVWGVHRGQGPKTAGLTLFPHFPSQVGALTQCTIALFNCSK